MSDASGGTILPSTGPVDTVGAKPWTGRSTSSALGVASLVTAVAVVALFQPLLQYVPTFLPTIAPAIGSGTGATIIMWLEVAGLAVAFLLGVVAVATRRGRAHAIGALVITVTVGAVVLPVLARIGGRA
jgi:hypothetical protein